MNEELKSRRVLDEAEDRATNAAIKAIAVASKTPFKTAFLASMGIAAAQFVSALLGIATLLLGGTIIYLLVK